MCDVYDYWGIRLSRNGAAIISVERQYRSQIWVAPDGDVERARSIASKSKVGASFGLSWTNKGRIVFSDIAGDNLYISLIDDDGSNQIQLTVNAGHNYAPATSPHGRPIAFAPPPPARFNICP